MTPPFEIVHDVRLLRRLTYVCNDLVSFALHLRLLKLGALSESRCQTQGSQFGQVCTRCCRLNPRAFTHFSSRTSRVFDLSRTDHRPHIHFGLENKANPDYTTTKCSCLCCHNSVARHSCGLISPLWHGIQAIASFEELLSRCNKSQIITCDLLCKKIHDTLEFRIVIQ